MMSGGKTQDITIKRFHTDAVAGTDEITTAEIFLQNGKYSSKITEMQRHISKLLLLLVVPYVT